MDEQILEKLISSDELISKTIEENSQKQKKTFDEFSSIMSMTTVNGEELERIIEEQGEKEAETIKATFSQGFNKSSELPLKTITEIESSKYEGGILSDETVNNLIDVISNVQNVLDNLQLQSVEFTTPTTLTPTVNNFVESTNQVEIPTVNLENINQVIDDFKTLSNLNWCKDWLNCLEKIVEQADVVKNALENIPSDKKIEFGINEEELKKVDDSIQKVKENITSDINLSVAKTEMIEQQTIGTEGQQLSNQFLNNFTEITEKISSFTDKVENNTISQESFLNKVNQFPEDTIKTIQNTFNSFNETYKSIIEKSNTLENFTSSQFKTELVSIESLEKLSATAPTEITNNLAQNVTSPLAIEQLTLPIIPTQIENPSTTVTQPTQIESVSQVTTQAAPQVTSTLALEQLTMPTIPTQVETEPTTVTQPTQVENPSTTVTSQVVPQVTPAMTLEQLTMPTIPTQVESVPQVAESEILSNTFFDNLMKLIPTKSITNESSEINKSFSFEDILSTQTITNKISNLSVDNQELNPLNLENLSSFAGSKGLNFLSENENNLPETENTIKFENIMTSVPNLLSKNFENPLMQDSTPFSSEQLDLNALSNIVGFDNSDNNSLIENAPVSNITQLKPSLQSELTSKAMIDNLGIKNEIEPSITSMSNVEDMLIRNQEIPQFNLATVASRLENKLPEPTFKKAASAEAMMSEVNLEPLGNQITTSISTLNDNISSSRNITENSVEPQNNQETATVMNDILSMLKKLDTTLETMSATKPMTNNMPSLGGSIGDSQARAIGRQIAYELKDSLSRLYN